MTRKELPKRTHVDLTSAFEDLAKPEPMEEELKGIYLEMTSGIPGCFERAYQALIDLDASIDRSLDAKHPPIPNKFIKPHYSPDRAILVDPFNHTIKEVVSDGILANIQKLVGYSSISFIRLPDDDTCDGIFKGNGEMDAENRAFFVVDDGYSKKIIAGRGLAVGFDRESGDSQSISCSLEEFSHKITFLTEGEAYLLAKEI
jgi:hypothetical protein